MDSKIEECVDPCGGLERLDRLLIVIFLAGIEILYSFSSRMLCTDFEIDTLSSLWRPNWDTSGADFEL